MWGDGMSKVEIFFNWIYIFFAWLGEGILRCPNRPFYLLVVILCILAPVFAIFTTTALLCGVYRRHANGF